MHTQLASDLGLAALHATRSDSGPAIRYPERGLNAAVKRALDLIGAAAGLLALSPLFGVIALLIKLDSPGEVFFRRRVVGQYGRPVNALKFRTMRPMPVVDADPAAAIDVPAGTLTQENDPRITRIGAFLRRASVDELPQFWNVLWGEMSLVGPRMFTLDEHVALAEFPDWRTAVIHAKPGMTGLWQVSGRRQLGYAQRVTLDLKYLQEWSLLFDVSLLFATIPAVLKRRGAF